MPTLTKTTEGTVTGLWGAALIRGSNGKMTRLKMGDVVHQGDHILTTQDGIVQITPPEGARFIAKVPPGELEFAAPGAGLSGGDSGALSEGYRVGRIVEALTPASLNFSANNGAVEFTRPVAGPGDSNGSPGSNGTPSAGSPPPVNLPPSALPNLLTGKEDTALPTPLQGQDSDGTVTSVTVTVLPAHGTLYLADGVTPVVAGTPLSPAAAAGLVFKPTQDFNGETQIVFTVTDDSGNTSSPATVTINLLPVNDLPVAANDLTSTNEDTPVTLSPAALLSNDTDVDGNALSIVSVQSPVHGTVSLVNGNVVFTPDPDYNGPASFTYTVSDGQGGTSTATVNVNVIPVVDPTISISDTVVNESAGTATFTVTLSEPTTVPVSVNYGTSDGTATAGSDYAATAGTLTFAPGVTSMTITVPVINDTVTEPSETFNVTLTTPINGTLAQGVGVGTIVDNDARPVLDLDANDSSGVPGANYVTTFTENGTAVAIGDVDVSITDADSATLQGATITLGNPHAGDVLAVGSLPAGITATIAGNVVTLSGAASAADYQAALHNVTFSNTSDNPDTTPRTIEVVVTDGVQISNVATTTVNVNAVNDPPVAGNDENNVTEDGTVTTLVVNAANGVIQSAGVPAGRDTDVDGGPLSVVGVHTGGEADVGAAGTVGSGLVGTYGTLTLNADGSYTYALNNSSAAVQNLNAGEVANDVFTYTVSDGQGGTDTATLTIHVTGSQDLTAGPPTLTPIIVSGLSGAYYGYNDTANVDPGLRTHADDGTATFGHHGVDGNLNAVEDVALLVDGRNQAAGGPGNIVGTNITAQTNAADVTFQGHHLDYGFAPPVDVALGSNAPVAAGAALPAGDGNPYSSAHGLGNFLGQDAAGATVQTGAANTLGTSGLGTTSDAAVRLSGQIYVQPGSYDFRVTADDGFRLTVAGETLLEYDGNQWPTARVFTNVPLGDLGGGLQSFELLYWEQGGNARLRIEYKPSDAPASEYQVMSDTNTGLFGNTNGPVLTDPRIQDLVFDSSTGGWQIRTGSMLDGDDGNNTLIGGVSRDLLRGGAGDDLLNGGGGADQLEGGTGNDTLIGGSGSDLLVGGSGNNVLEGGTGDDTYRLSDGNDTLIEKPGEGVDTIQLDASYVASHSGSTYALAENFENLTAQGTDPINLVGNSADNRLIGNAADNQLDGRDGNDYLVGGAGNDTLTGGAGADVFAWHLADAGTPGRPAVDTVTDFNFIGGHSTIESGVSGVPIGGGDVLDLRDLLQGEHTSAGGLGTPASEVELSNLTNYIDVEVVGGNTVLHISTAGGFAGGTFNPSAEDERIVLEGVDLYAVTGISTGDENALLKTLIKSGSMIVD